MRTIKRFIKGYEQEGESYFIHGNCPTTPFARTRDERSYALAKELLWAQAIAVETVQPNIEVSPSNAHPRRPRSGRFGETIQMDASLHSWFGTEKQTLHIAQNLSLK
jgi:hypothetical protein